MFSAARQIQLGPLLFGLFLPAFIFEATWNLDAAALWRVRRGRRLALPGVLFTAAAIALRARSSSVDWGAALALGAILNATDPIAVLALFRRMSLPAELIAIFEGESIGNDAAARVLGQTVVPLVSSGVGEALGIAVLRLRVRRLRGRGPARMRRRARCRSSGRSIATPMRRGFLYLFAVLDWATRRVLPWQLSNTLAPNRKVRLPGDPKRPLRRTFALMRKRAVGYNPYRLQVVITSLAHVGPRVAPRGTDQ